MIIVGKVACSASGVITDVPKRYFGFSLRETTGSAAAVVRLFDGSSASGTPLEEISLAAGESAREMYPMGVEVLSGIYAQVVSGSVVGSIRLEA